MSDSGARPTLPAIGLIVIAAACFTAIDTVVKYLGSRYPVPMLVWVRWGVPALMMVALFGPAMKWGLVRTGNLKLHVLRGAVLMLSSLCSFAALKLLPMAEATGLFYLTPVLVTVMAAWLLREPITRPRWIFVAAGFAGMLLIVRPAAPMLDVAALLALGAAALNAAFQLLTRKLAREDLMVLIFYPSLVGAALMSFTVPFVDDPASFPAADVLLFLAIGAIGAFAHFLFIRAFQRAPASTIAPFTYVQLVWSTLAGWIAFGTSPDVWAMAGLIVIAASGVMVIWYERRRAREAAERAAGERRGAMTIGFPGVSFSAPQRDNAWPLMGRTRVKVGESLAIPNSSGGIKIVVRTD